MDERDTRDPLRGLEERLDKARGRQRPAAGAPRAEDGGDNRGAIGIALRIGTELVVAVVVGTAIGWALDHWLGTRPWGMIGFFFLGVAAGMMNVYRAVTGMGMAVGYRRDEKSAAAETKKADWSDDED